MNSRPLYRIFITNSKPNAEQMITNDIVALVGEDPFRDFSSWKQNRHSVISRLGGVLVALPEGDIAKSCKGWDEMISAQLKTGNTHTQMTALMAFSVVHHFLGDLGHLNEVVEAMGHLMVSASLELTKAVVQVVIWATDVTPVFGQQMFSQALEPAFKHIRARKEKYYASALWVIKSARVFAELEVVQFMIADYDAICAVTESTDARLRMLAVDIIMFHHTYTIKRGGVVMPESISEWCEVVEEAVAPFRVDHMHAPLLVVTGVFQLCPEIFKARIPRMMEKMLQMITVRNELVSVGAYEWLVSVAKGGCIEFSDASISEMFRGIAGRYTKNGMSESYVAVLDQMIIIFGEQLPVDDLKELVAKLLMTRKSKVTTLGFQLYSRMMEVLPKVQMPSSVFLSASPCVNYIKCLRQWETLPDDISQYLLDAVQRGLSPTAQAGAMLLSCRLVRQFQLQMFESSEAIYDAVCAIFSGATDAIRCEVVKTMALVKTEQAGKFLLDAALYDSSKVVRQLALVSWTPTRKSAMKTRILMTLNDPSFAVRRKGLAIVGKMMKWNPLDFHCAISEYANEVLAAVISQADIRQATKQASLLPTIVEHFLSTVEPLVRNIISVCLNLLYIGKGNGENACGTQLKGMEVWRSGFGGPVSFSHRIAEREVLEPTRTKIYKRVNSKFLMKRDKYLLKALAFLGSEVEPYLNDVLDAFGRILKRKKPTQLLCSAVKSLTILAQGIGSGLNLRLHHQQFIPILMQLLISAQNDDVCVAILKLFGTACDSVTTSEVGTSVQLELAFDVTSKSFFTDFTIRHLIPYFDHPTTQLFEAVACIYDLAPKDAAKFVHLVIPMFLKGLEMASDTQRDILFGFLEIIVRECPVESSMFLPQLTQVQLKFFRLVSAVKLAAALSFHLMSVYTLDAALLFLPACRKIGTNHYMYFKCVMKFVSFAVLFQEMPFDSVIWAIEKNIGEGSKTLLKPRYMKVVIKSLSCLVQGKDLSLFQSRLALLMSRILQDEQCQSIAITIIPSLVVHTGLPLMIVETWKNSLGLNLPFLAQMKEGSANGPDMSLVRRVNATFKDRHACEWKEPETGELFSDLKVPDNVSIAQWLKVLCDRVIGGSPSVVIRSCGILMSTMVPFRQQLFPLAFLACWRRTSHAERVHFSRIVSQILRTIRPVDPFFQHIIELLDRADMPLLIDDAELVKVADSRPLKMFFLQRMFKNDPKNHAIIDDLLDLNTTMGRHAAAHGMLVHAKGLLEDTKAALWNEKLGEWHQALKLYGDSNADVSSILRCYDHLEMWDHIKQMSGQFEEWSVELQEENAKHLAWAYYRSGEFNKVDYYARLFHGDLHLSEMLFNAFYRLRTAKYDLCQETITEAFSNLARDTSVYIGGDAIRLHKNLHYCHMFVELQEALDILRKGAVDKEKVAIMWNKRLDDFRRDSESWIRLISIRSLVFPPDDYVNVYLKMVAVLRKERRWDLIDGYFNRFFSQSILPTIDLAEGKIMWSRGQKEDAIEVLRGTLDIISLRGLRSLTLGLMKIHERKFFGMFVTLMKTPSFDDELKESCASMIGAESADTIVETLRGREPSEQKTFVCDLYKCETEKMGRCFSEMFVSFQTDGALEGRICRTLASFMDGWYGRTSESIVEVSTIYKHGTKVSASDYKLWLGWAYTNTRMIDVCRDNDAYYVNAIDGFLRATELRSSNTLEFMGQMFSIFVRMENSSLVSSKLTPRLLALPAKIVDRIVPQITVQIAHTGAAIRHVVHNILEKFGEQHFQALFYPLKLYEASDHKEKAQAAHDLLTKLGEDHAPEAMDGNVFVEGMLRAAMLLFEQWEVSLYNACTAYDEKDIQRMDQILNGLFTRYENPKCGFDQMFIRQNNQFVTYCQNLFKTHTNGSLDEMWSKLKTFMKQLHEQGKRLDFILLPKVSEILATKRDYAIAVPGTYSVKHSVPHLQSIEPALEILGTQQHPRIVMIIASDGRKAKFLLKGNEDIRLDQRVMQFFRLVNTRLKDSGRAIGITNYATVPLSPNAGLITWVNGADTLHQMIAERRSLHGMSQSMETDRIAGFVGNLFPKLTGAQRMDLFSVIAEEFKANEVRELLWQRAGNAATWITQIHNFTVTMALMSMVGYTIGLGDRHPSNIMVQRETGAVIHIDFGDSFEIAMLRQNVPERAPFRLTRMIINALDCGTVEGLFRKTCEDVMGVLRNSRASLVALLDIFVHEPLDETSGGVRQTSQAKVARVGQKLLGRDVKLPVYRDTEKDMDIETQVDALITEAGDPWNYIMHWHGWCPFW